MKIALIDDHSILSETLGLSLEKHIPDSEIKIFSHGEQFLSSNFAAWKPEVIVVDMLMPGMNGLEVLSRVKELFGDDCKVILLTSIIDVHTIRNAMRIGASGYLSKDVSIPELIEAIETVTNDDQYIEKKLRNSLVKYVFEEDRIVFHLSPREKEVLDLICSGKTPKEIAYEINLSVHTVQEYLRAVMKKFKVNRTTDLVVFAIQKGLYNPGFSK